MRIDATRESLDSIISAINKKYGENIIVQGNQVKEEVPRITTGILAYDLMLGGGWPANQWSEIIGDESSGKTALALGNKADALKYFTDIKENYESLAEAPVSPTAAAAPRGSRKLSSTISTSRPLV